MLTPRTIYTVEYDTSDDWYEFICAADKHSAELTKKKLKEAGMINVRICTNVVVKDFDENDIDGMMEWISSGEN